MRLAFGLVDVEREHPFTGEAQVAHHASARLLRLGVQVCGAVEFERSLIVVGEDVGQVGATLARLLFDPGCRPPDGAAARAARGICS